jgi:hypothetical protein
VPPVKSESDRWKFGTAYGWRRSDLDADPAEETELAARQPALADTLEANLRAWHDSVLRSLTGAPYRYGYGVSSEWHLVKGPQIALHSLAVAAAVDDLAVATTRAG